MVSQSLGVVKEKRRWSLESKKYLIHPDFTVTMQKTLLNSEVLKFILIGIKST